MPYTPKTLADMKQSLADRHDNGRVPTNTTILARYVRLLNRGVDYCVDRMRISKAATVTVASGVGSLPDDFLVINSVFLGEVPYFQVDPEDETVHLGLAYWITGNQTDGFTLHSVDDGDFTVNYSFRPAPLASDADVCVIPDIEAPVAYAYAMLRKGESDPFEDAEISLQECDSRLREMQSVKSINEDAMSFTIQ